MIIPRKPVTLCVFLAFWLFVAINDTGENTNDKLFTGVNDTAKFFPTVDKLFSSMASLSLHRQ